MIDNTKVFELLASLAGSMCAFFAHRLESGDIEESDEIVESIHCLDMVKNNLKQLANG